VRKPHIHLNGTSRDALAGAYIEAGQHVYAAMKALAEAAPNGRDYYPLGAGAFSEAQREHEARMAKLRDVYAEISDLVEHVVDTPL
jgi:hypothetical protein